MKDRNKYYRDVKKLFPVNGKKEKDYLKNIKEQIDEYDDYTYEQLEQTFGTPIEVVTSYYQTINSAYLLKRINLKRIVNIAISIMIVLSITLWGFEMYRLNQLYEEVKTQIHGHYEETIEDFEEVGD